jgi:TATA-box binding protein (TBP) (component of TFIID and TFIIIB)
MNANTSSNGKNKKGANSGKDAKKKKKKKKRSSRSSTQAIEVSASVKVSRIITSIGYEYSLNILAIVLFLEIAFND